MRAKRILYVQYTNPAGYPPLEHSSRLLAARGWEVVFLGIRMPATDGLSFPPHEAIRVLLMTSQAPGWRQKLHYLHYCAWVLLWCLRWRPTAVYASDHLACLPAWLAKRLLGQKVIYHEHDAPATDPGSRLLRGLAYARRALVSAADRVVVPNATRGSALVREGGILSDRVVTVWNCPRLDEVPPVEAKPDGPLVLYYHGNLSPPLLPLTVIEAIAHFDGAVHLFAVGYETVGTVGYRDQLLECAARRGAADWVRIEPARSRIDLWPLLTRAHVGLALMPKRSPDLNMTAMVGASNKAFDYLAATLPLLVTDLPEWCREFVEPGYALPCDPDDPKSIAVALRWFLDHPGDAARMAERGRRMILDAWNYDTQFTPVLGYLEQLATNSLV